MFWFDCLGWFLRWFLSGLVLGGFWFVFVGFGVGSGVCCWFWVSQHLLIRMYIVGVGISGE